MRLPVLVSGSVALVLLAVGCSGSGTDDDSAGSSPSPPPASASSPPAATPSASPTPTPQPRTFTLAATGDVLLHERLWVQARKDAAAGTTMDFAPQLASIKPVISAADLAICHLEVPLAPADGPYEGYPTFSGPPQVVTGLAATGYDACTTASNHTFDQGAAGVDRTLEMLDQAGLAHAGSARSPQEAQRTSILQVDTDGAPVTVALLSYTFGFNGIPYPDGETWRSNEIVEADIVADAATARADGADVVVAALHWGDEYVHEPNELQRDLAPQLIRSPDIDLLLGHHAHVVQPVQNVDGEWIVYGMGNLMANHAEPQGPKSEGLLTRFTFTENLDDGGFDVSAAEYLPLYQTYEPPVEVLDVVTALRTGDVGTAGKARLEQALARTTQVVESLGGADDGLRMLASS
ncbi:CapA family protein [Haloactinopolyspora sp.]|uniref:CapA family protein n=1 Tax=Haloactinopolyspora sp. TaxID=1966353 RepID=UPI00261ED9E4|nr:CapA family protein [Haloactinopolyspora sp.]